MDKFEINPFDRSALTDYKLLAGRKTEFTQIRYILRNAANQQNRIRSILISGDRGVGKTSFLNLIEAECHSNNLIPIRLNLTESNSCNSNEFFWYLFNQLLSKVFNLNFFGGKAGQIDVAVQKILYSDGLNDQVNYVFRTPILRKNYLQNLNSIFEFDQLIEDLKVIRKEIINSNTDQYNDKTKFYFLVDETQNIYSNTKIIEDIRFIIQNQDIGVGFVFAGDTSFLSSNWEKVFGGSYREFELISLNYFSEVESVIDYFSKSLESIGWTEDEIENKLFYRFKYACRLIFYMTSGKPAWINAIASKMFERCMNKESLVLKFDKQAQFDIKKILEDSGQIDKSKIDFIDSLAPHLQKWLAVLFSCELNTLESVYFYSKFFLIGENSLSKNSFKLFCEDLIKRKIIFLVEKKSETTLGYKSISENDNLLDSKYFSFGFDADSIKQWLQINSEGKFLFNFQNPSNFFFNTINSDIIFEKNNTVIISSPFKSPEEEFRISNIIEKINNGEYSVSDELFESVEFIYKFYKKMENSKERQVLFGLLRDLNSCKIKTWNLYNYDDSGKISGFIDSPNKLKRYISNVKSFYSENHKFELELNIDKINNLNLESFRKLIIESKDIKKIGIILNDKLEELVRKYLKDSDIDASYNNAIFFYNLYEEGHDLNIKTLNNTSYVFIAKNDINKANVLLTEAIRKIKTENLDTEEIDSACLAQYNYALLQIMNDKYELGLKLFKNLINIIDDKLNFDDSAGALKVLMLDENNKLKIVEIKEGDPDYSKISCKKETLNNIKILQMLNIEEY